MPGSTIEPTRGGRVFIRHPNGIESSGEVVEVVPPTRIVFTYGFNSGNPIPPGSSRVTISLKPFGAVTRLELMHEFAEPGPRDEHMQGWRYQLSVFGNVGRRPRQRRRRRQWSIAWYRAWSETSEDARRQLLSTIASADVQFHDRFSLLDGLADLVPHIGATQRFMPDMHLARKGEVRHCQGTLLVGWTAAGGDGQERASGTNVFTLGGDGKIVSVTGFWDPPKPTH